MKEESLAVKKKVLDGSSGSSSVLSSIYSGNGIFVFFLRFFVNIGGFFSHFGTRLPNYTMIVFGFPKFAQCE